MVKKLAVIFGIVFAICGIAFLPADIFIVTTTGVGKRDIFGLPIPQPPVWVPFIPYIGNFLRFVFESFSLHGVVGLTIFITIMSIAGNLIRYGSTVGRNIEKQPLQNQKQKPFLPSEHDKKFAANLNRNVLIFPLIKENKEAKRSDDRPAEDENNKDWAQQLVDNFKENLKKEKLGR